LRFWFNDGDGFRHSIRIRLSSRNGLRGGGGLCSDVRGLGLRHGSVCGVDSDIRRGITWLFRHFGSRSDRRSCNGASGHWGRLVPFVVVFFCLDGSFCLLDGLF